MNSTVIAEFNDRCVMLGDGRAGLRGTLPVQVGESDGSPGAATGAACLDFIASSETLDRFQEIIAVDGWRLENYRRNPVFQNAHQYGDIIFTLGKALITEVRALGGERVLFQRIEFAIDVNPLARIAYGLYKGKFLNAVSVGFIPVRWETGEEGAAFRRRFVEQELLEVSAVGIPANPQALALGLKAGAIERNDARELASLLRWLEPAVTGPRDANTLRSPQADSQTHAGASGLGNNEARWLRLARELAVTLNPPARLKPPNGPASVHSL